MLQQPSGLAGCAEVNNGFYFTVVSGINLLDNALKTLLYPFLYFNSKSVIKAVKYLTHIKEGIKLVAVLSCNVTKIMFLYTLYLIC